MPVSALYTCICWVLCVCFYMTDILSQFIYFTSMGQLIGLKIITSYNLEWNSVKYLYKMSLTWI